MMKKLVCLMLACLMLLGAAPMALADGSGYQQIDQETAKAMMAEDDSHLVLDVRRLDEFESGHIPGALCLPNEEIGEELPELLPNITQILLVYCRSGNRSKQAAEKLAALGYTNVYEFGGIQDWTGEVVTGQTVAVTVESNPTTGFCWTVAQDQELFDVRDVYASEYHEEPLAGGGGWQTFILSPKEAGEVELTFTYSRSWEQSEFDTQFVCRFAVNEDLTVTVLEDGAGQAAESGYAPVIRIF